MGRRLHLGGKIRADGWEIFGAVPGDHVDHLGNANDLTRFPNHTFDELYASHILEHFDYQDELHRVLVEWHRVLIPGGLLYISVPDLDTLCSLLLDRRLTVAQRFDIMRMLFGGHVDEWDYHQVGLNHEFLGGYLKGAGFSSIQRVRKLGLFDDTSSMVVAEQFLSLNVIAFK